MSTDPDRKSASPDVLQPSQPGDCATDKQSGVDQEVDPTKPEKALRKVSFPPEDAQLVTEYFEPANPWHDVPTTTREQLVAEYLESCRRHRASPIPSVLEQIQDLPENTIGGATRAPRLTLSECALTGTAPVDALEAVLRRTQFRRLEVDHATLDDQGAEALFDMIEYYESAVTLSIAGPRHFGVHGWQAASRMIKKSAELSELEVHSGSVEASHAAVLARALRPHSCRLRALALQRAALTGEPLLCLVIALKSNSSVRELRLGDNQLSAADATQLAALLRANALIQLLDLSNNQIQDAGVGQIADALVEQAAQTPPSAATSPLSPHHCPLGGYDSRGLAFLVLWNNQLTRNCATHLSKALRSSASLCVLNVGRNALGRDAVNSLHGPALVSLGLQAVRLGPDSAKPLADLIRHSPRLQRLDLRDNKMDPGALQAILQAMKDNRTLMQIDLDDAADSSTLSAAENTAATCARLTREIRALCQRNEPLTSAHRVHRKISLTCRSACLQPGVQEEERKGGRLRSPAPSPAPSPAGSPVPGASPHSRFSVTRVTPERESSTSSNESGSPSTPSPSRFRVMQVSEPPQIHVQCAEPRRSASRFSVTRNYDTIYNPTPKTSVAELKSDLITAKDSMLVARAAKGDILITKDSALTKVAKVLTSEDSALTKVAKEVVTSEDRVVAKVAKEVVRNEDGALAKVSKEVARSKDSALSKMAKEVVRSEDSALSKVAKEVLRSEDSALTNVAKEVVRSEDSALTKVAKEVVRSEDSALTKVAKEVVRSEDSALSKVAKEVVRSENSALSKVAKEVVRSEDSALSKVAKEVVRSEDSALSKVAKEVIRSEDSALSKVTKEVVRSKDSLLTEKMEEVCGKCDVLKSRESVLIAEVAKNVSECDVLTIKAAKTVAEVPKCDILVTTVFDDDLLSTKTAEVESEASESDVLSKDSVLIAKTAEAVGETDLLPKKGTVLIEKTATVSTGVPECDVLLTKTPEHGVLTTKDSVLKTKATKAASEVTIVTSEISEYEALTKESVLMTQATKLASELYDLVTKDNIIVTKAITGSTESEILKDNTVVIKPDVQKFECKDLLINSELINKVASLGINVAEYDVEATSDVPTAKDVVATHVETHQTKVETPKVNPDIRECTLQASRNEEQSSMTVSQSNKVDIKSPNDLHTAGDVIVTAIVVQDAKPNVQIAKEVESTACTSEVSANTPEIRIAEHVHIDKQIEGKTIKEQENADIAQNVEAIVQASKDSGDAEARSDIRIAKNDSIEACHKSVSLKSDISVTSDKTLSETSGAPVVESAQSNTATGDSKISVKTDGSSDGSVKSSACKDKTDQMCHDECRRLVDEKETVLKEPNLRTNTTAVSETDRLDVKVEVSVKLDTDNANCENKLDCSSKSSVSSTVNNPAKVHPKQNVPSGKQDHRSDEAFRQFEAITEDLNTLIQDMQNLSTKTSIRKSTETSTLKSDYTQTDSLEVTEVNTVTATIRESVILKKNKSESSLDSPDLEVSRLMTRKPVPYCDSSSSYSGSSMESLTAGQTRQTIVERTVDTSLDRRKAEVAFSTGSSLESSDATPVNSANLLNTSMSSQDSVSPVFGAKKKIHGSLSSLEASVSSLDSARGTERLMVTSADSGIEYSLQQPSDSKEDSSSNEGTLTNTSSLKDTAHSERGDFLQSMQDTLTSPKRDSSLLDVPASKDKSAERVRKISIVAPSPSFTGPKSEEPKESKLPTNLEKLLSLFHNPGSLFSRSNSQNDDERKAASYTPPRKEPSSLTSSFWTWGNPDRGPEREEDRGSSPENTDSTLSERVQVSYVDESFSKKLDSKTPSTDTDNTLSEFQSSTHCTSDGNDVTIETTDDNIVQNVDLSVNAAASPNGNGTGGQADLSKPNDMNRNVYDNAEELAISSDSKPDTSGDAKAIDTRPRSFAAVLKSSATENTDRQASPESGQSVDKLSSKVIRGIKENISPENTLTSSMTNTKTLSLELNERQVKNQPIVNAVWEIATDICDAKSKVAREQVLLDVEASKSTDTKEPLDTSIDSGVTSLDEQAKSEKQTECREIVDLGKDALSYLIYENQDFEPDSEPPVIEAKTENLPVLAEELRDADLKNLDLSPELVIDLPTNSDLPEVFASKDLHIASPIAPERAKVKSNSLEDLSQRLHSAISMETAVAPRTKPRNIVFNVPEASGTTPRDIPERRTKLRSRSGSSPKSLPETFSKPAPSSKLESVCKKKKKVSSLGKIARDSLLALNRTEEEIADIRREYKLTSVESLRSLESVSEDANSQSGNSADSRCRCLRGSQESLMSLDSISEDCRCDSECDKSEGHAR